MSRWTVLSLALVLGACSPVDLSETYVEQEVETLVELAPSDPGCQVDALQDVLEPLGGSLGERHNNDVYQYWDYLENRYGGVGCTFMAVATGFSDDGADARRRDEIMRVVEAQDGLDFDIDYGVYPHNYTRAWAQAFDGEHRTASEGALPAQVVQGFNHATLADIAAALSQGAQVMLEFNVVTYPHHTYPLLAEPYFQHPGDECIYPDGAADTPTPTATRPRCVVHTGRVLGIDSDQIFIENSLHYGISYWAIPLPKFLDNWGRNYFGASSCKDSPASCPMVSSWMTTLSDEPLELPSRGCTSPDLRCDEVIQVPPYSEFSISLETGSAGRLRATTPFALQGANGEVIARAGAASASGVFAANLDRDRPRASVTGSAESSPAIVALSCDAGLLVDYVDLVDPARWVRRRLMASGHLSFETADDSDLEARRALASFQGWNLQPYGESTLETVTGVADAETIWKLQETMRFGSRGHARAPGTVSLRGLDEEHTLRYLRHIFDESNSSATPFDDSPWGVNFVQIRGFLDGAAVQNRPNRYNDTIYALVNDASGRLARYVELRASSDYGTNASLADYGADWAGTPERGTVFGPHLGHTRGLVVTKPGQVIGYHVGQHLDYGLGLIDPAWGLPAGRVPDNAVRAHVDFNRSGQIDAREWEYEPTISVVNNIHVGTSGGKVNGWSAGCHPVTTDGSYQALTLLVFASGQAEAALRQGVMSYDDLLGNRRGPLHYDERGLARILGAEFLGRLRGRLGGLYTSVGMPAEQAGHIGADGTQVWRGPVRILREQVFPFAVVDSRSLPDPVEVFAR